MSERQKGLRIVGGTDYGDAPVAETGPKEVLKAPERVEFYLLVALWTRIISNLPADYDARTRPELVREATEQVAPWGVSELHAYLLRPDIWERPSFTKAVIEEVRLRMQTYDFSPRG
jgi:hypothetical protein